MTTLRTFQTEIDEIQHREIARQRTHVPVEKVKDKDVKRTGAKVIQQAGDKVTDTQTSLSSAELSDVDERIQVNSSCFLYIT